VHIVVVVTGQRYLLEVVGALHASSGGADLLNGGQEQAHDEGDDRDRHKKLDQREPR
jgi:hypothetical protein